MDYATKYSPPLLLVGGYQLLCWNCGGCDNQIDDVKKITV